MMTPTLVEWERTVDVADCELVTFQNVLETVQLTIDQEPGVNIRIRLKGVDETSLAHFSGELQGECTIVGANIETSATHGN